MGRIFNSLAICLAVGVFAPLTLRADVTESSAVVTTTADVVDDNDGVTSLREAINAANSRGSGASGYLITFSPDLYSRGAITCVVSNGPFSIASNMSIIGPSADLVTLDAMHGNRLFTVTSGRMFGLSRVAVKNGAAGEKGGAILISSSMSGLVSIEDCVFADNTAEVDGGAIYHEGSSVPLVTRCRFEDNGAGEEGGALFAAPNREIQIFNSSFARNTADFGGALAGAGGWTVFNSTFVKNVANHYGGVYKLDAGSTSTTPVTFINTTMRGNRASDGGGALSIQQPCTLKLWNTVVTGNSTTNQQYNTRDIRISTNANITVSARGLVAYSCDGISANEAFRIIVNETVAADSYVFANSVAGSKMTGVGGTRQYIEPLKNKSYNPALTGFSDASHRTDITGRNFDFNQMGSLWRRAETATLQVTSLGDAVDADDGQTTLREILVGISSGNVAYQSLKAGGKYGITFASSLRGTLSLAGAQYEIVNTDAPVSIDGGGRVTFYGDGLHRAFYVGKGSTLELKNLGFTSCLGAVTHTSRTTTGSDGGAILNLGTLSVEDCSFGSCSAGITFGNPVGNGGAVANGASGVTGAKAVLTDCSFADCRAARGGAVYNYPNNDVTLTGCSFLSNRAGGGTAVLGSAGGALCNAAKGTLDYSGCSFTDNTILLDGVETPSDYTDWNKPFYTLRVANGAMAVDLNELALPDLTTSELSVGDETVTLTIDNVKPLLYYGLGHAPTVGAAFVVEPDGWVQADADGHLPGALTAPAEKQGRGFYKVYVSIDPAGNP